MANQISPTDLAMGLSEFFHNWGLENLKVAISSDGTSLEFLYGVGVAPISAALAIGEYENLVQNEGYSPSDAIAKVGCEIIGGLAGGAGFEALDVSAGVWFPFLESPLALAIAGSLGSVGGSWLGGELANYLRSSACPSDQIMIPTI